MRGLVIAIEGIDGSGKHTISMRLQEKLNNAEVISFPRHQEEFSGDLVDRFLYDGLRFSDNEYKAVREGMLYAIDRMVALGRIRENGKSKLDELEEGKNLIFDRYLSSNFIHRCNNMSVEELKLYITKMKHVEFHLMGLPEPDITFVLSVKPEVSYRNIIKRGRQLDDNETIENLTDSYNKLQCLCDLEGYELIECCKEVDGEYEMLTVDEILEKVVEVLRDKFC